MQRNVKVVTVVAILLFAHCVTSSFIHKAKAGTYNPLDYYGNWCLSFDGKDDYVDCGNDQIFKQQNLTLEAWIKPKYPIQIGSYPFYYNRSSGIVMCYQSNDGTYLGNTGWWLQFDYANGPLNFGWRYSSDYSWEYRSYPSNRVIWQNTTWYHVVVIFNNGNLKFYINGTLDAQHSDSHGIRYDGSRFQVGGFQNSNFSGLIDEVRVWNISRTQSEIESTWERIINGTELENPNLIGYWRFDNGTGSMYAHDYSRQGNNGILLPYSNPPQWIGDTSPVIPEFTLFLIVPIFETATLLSALLFRKKYGTKAISAQS